jgi:hypothetical protein
MGLRPIDARHGPSVSPSSDRLAGRSIGAHPRATKRSALHPLACATLSLGSRCTQRRGLGVPLPSTLHICQIVPIGAKLGWIRGRERALLSFARDYDGSAELRWYLMELFRGGRRCAAKRARLGDYTLGNLARRGELLVPRWSCLDRRGRTTYFTGAATTMSRCVYVE